MAPPAARRRFAPAPPLNQSRACFLRVRGPPPPAGARETSRWMPFIKGALDGHDPQPIPTNWARGEPRLAKLSAYGQKLAQQSRARALRQYTSLFPDAFGRYAGALGEGMPCAGRCSQVEL